MAFDFDAGSAQPEKFDFDVSSATPDNAPSGGSATAAKASPAPAPAPGIVDRAIKGVKDAADSVADVGRAIKDKFGEGEGGTIRTVGQVLGATPEGTLGTLANLGGKVLEYGGKLVDAYGKAAAPGDQAVMNTIGAKPAPQQGPSQPSPGQAATAYMRDSVAPAAAQLAAQGRARVAREVSDPHTDPAVKARYQAGQALEDVGKNQQQFYRDKIDAESPQMAAQSKAISDASGFFDTVKAMALNPLGTAGVIAQSAPDLAVGAGLSRAAALARMTQATGLATEAAQVGNKAFEDALVNAASNPATLGQARAIANQARIDAVNAHIEGAAERAAGGAGLLTESVQSGAGTRAQVQDVVAAQPDADLQKNNARYRELRQQHDEAEAKSILGDELGNQAAGQAALWTGAAGKASGAADAWGHTLAGQPVTLKQALGGTAKEALEEGLQNPGEDYAGYQAQVQADPSQQYDFGGSVAQGLVAGAAQGGAVHGAGAVNTAVSQTPLQRAHQVGFTVSPPLTTDTPGVQRNKLATMFKDLGAKYGLPADVIDATLKQADGKPLSEMGGFLQKATVAFQKRNFFGEEVPLDALGVFSGPHDPTWDEAKTEVQQKPEQRVEPTGDVGATALPEAPINQAASPIESSMADRLSAGLGVEDQVGQQGPVSPEASQIHEAAHEAATSPHNDLPEPTEAQKAAGNYQKGHIKVQGLDIAIENPAGSTRSGVNLDGVAWQTTMQHHYGYLKGTIGADKDHVDAFIGPNPESAKAYVIDQVDPKTGSFDEHKVVLGADSLDQAQEIYQSNYAADWKGGAAITELPIAAFKSWVKDGAKKQPLGDIAGHQVPVEAAGQAATEAPAEPENVAPMAAPAAVQPAPEPAAAPAFKFEQRQDGTVTVLGKPADIKAALPDFKGIAGNRGVTYGRSAAAAVVHALTPKSGEHAELGPAFSLAGDDGKAQAPAGSPNEFVQAPGGGTDFGEITPDMAKAMRRQAGKIRLQVGEHDDKTKRGFGLAHIEARHGKQIRALGYSSIEDFVKEAAGHIDQVWQPGQTKQIVAVVTGKSGRVMFLELKPHDDADFYSVNSAFPGTAASYTATKQRKEGWKPLWSRSPVPADASGASNFVGQPPKAGEAAPMGRSQSGDTSVTPAVESGKQAAKAEALEGSEPQSTVPGQQPAFATETPEKKSSQGSPNARGQSGDSLTERDESGKPDEEIGPSLTRSAAAPVVDQRGISDKTLVGGNPAHGPISREEIDGVVSLFLNKVQAIGTRQVVVLDDPHALPAEIQQAAHGQDAALDEIEGVAHKGKVYLVRSAIRDADHAEQVLFHEVYGHLGASVVMGGRTVRALNAVWFEINGLAGVKKIAQRYKMENGRTVWDRLQPYIEGSRGMPATQRQAMIVDELIAFMAQRNDTSRLTQFKAYLSDLKASVAALLRKHGLNRLADKIDRLSPETGVLALVRDARNAIVTGRTKSGQEVRFVRQAADGSKVQAFSQSEEGRPLTRFKSRTDAEASEHTGGARSEDDASVSDEGSPAFALAAGKPEAPAETTARKVQRHLQDQLNRFTVISDWAKKNGVNLTPDANVWEFEERMHGRVAAKFEDFREKTAKPLIKEIQRAGFTMAQVDQFLHAQHAEERNNQIESIDPDTKNGSGMETADAKAILAKADPKLARLANKLRAITASTKDILLQAGIINKDMTDAWDAAYKHYVPLKGGDDTGVRQGTGKGLSVSGKQKRAMGHGERDEHIAENILRDHERAILLAEKNIVGHSLLSLVHELKNENIATIGTPERRKVLRNTTDYEVVDSSGASLGTFDSQQAANQFIVNQQTLGLKVRPVRGDPIVSYMARPMLADNEVQVYLKGHAVRVQLNDPLLARAYQKMGQDGLNRLLAINRDINAFLSKAYTGHNPEFLLKNVTRDFTGGVVNITGKFGAAVTAKSIANYPRAVKELAAYSFRGKESEAVKAYRAAGGTTGAAYLSDIERIGKDIQESYDDYQGVIAALKKGQSLKAARVSGRKLLGAVLGWIEHLNAVGESAYRLAVFEAVRSTKGYTVNDAGSAAKNATVNFNRRGELTKFLGPLYLFFNPAIQGGAVIMDTLANGKHRKQAWALTASIAGLAYGLAHLQFGGGDDDDQAWRAIPDSVKDKNIVIRRADGSLITIPFAPGYSFLMTLGNGIYDLQHGRPADEVSLNIASALIDNFSPVKPVGSDGFDSRGLVEFTPGLFGGEIMRNVARLAVNRSGLGGDIVPDSPFDTGKPDHMRMFRSTKGSLYDTVASGLNNLTGGTATQAGMLDVSPETLKFWTKALAGGAGAFAADSVSAANLWLESKKAGSAGDAEALMPDVRDVPIVRGFVRETSIQDSRRQFWELAKKVQSTVEDLKRAERGGDAAGYDSVVASRKEFLALTDAIKDMRDLAKGKREAIDAINADEKTTLAYKRAAVRNLEREEGAAYANFAAYVAEQRKQLKASSQ